MSDDQGIKIGYADTGEYADSFQQSQALSLPFAEALERLKAAIMAADLWIVGEIDPQMLALRGGYIVGGARQILFFHPRFLARIFEGDLSAVLEAPLKILLLELPTGGTIIRWMDPISSFGRYGSLPLDKLGRELAAICEKITAGFR